MAAFFATSPSTHAGLLIEIYHLKGAVEDQLEEPSWNTREASERTDLLVVEFERCSSDWLSRILEHVLEIVATMVGQTL